MSRAKQFMWMGLTALGVAGFAWLGVSEIEDARATPTAPADRSLAELMASPAPTWVRLVDGVPRCDRIVRANDHDVVPVVTPETVDVDRRTRVLLLALEKNELCASLAPPLLVEPLQRSAYARRILKEVPFDAGGIIGGDVFGLEPDAIGAARTNVVVPLLLMVACIGALALQLRALRARASTRLGSVGDVGAAPAAGVFDALVQGSPASAGESVLPPGALSLSAAAERQAWRAKHLAPAIVGAAGLASAALSVWGTVGVVDDLRAWHGGVEVPAELKGSTTSKLLFSFVDVELAWQMPGESSVRTASRMFMTLWMADKDAGSVRALVDDPTVVTFEEAVDLVPFRIPLLLAGFALAGGCVVGARSRRRSADQLRHIAATAVEGVLRSPSIVENRVNGAVVGFTLNGLLDGKPVSTSITARPGPAGLVVADDSGGILVVKSADGTAFTPLYTDGEPFLWSPSAWTHAQAVLAARGSPTRLAEERAG